MPTKKSQNSGNEVGYKKPPKNRQFGQPEGNKQGRGFFKIEDTPRAKLEKVLKMSEAELEIVRSNLDGSKFERDVADVLLDEKLTKREKWSILESMINQVYGQPKQPIDHTMTMPKPLVDLTKRTKNGSK